LLPYNDLEHEKQERSTVFWILISLIGASTLLGILGVIVEYTKLGNVKLSHEETNFNNIDIPVI
jgi:hypothetical protein